MGVRLLWWFPYPISQMENDRDKVKAFEKIISNSEEDRRDFELQLRGKDDIIKRLDQELQNISIENSQRSIEYNQLAQEMKLQQEMPGPVFEDGESLSGVAELQFMGKLEQLQVMPPLHRMAIFVPPVCDLPCATFGECGRIASARAPDHIPKQQSPAVYCCHRGPVCFVQTHFHRTPRLLTPTLEQTPSAKTSR